MMEKINKVFFINGDLNDELIDRQREIESQKQVIKQFNIDTEELEFLRLN